MSHSTHIYHTKPPCFIIFSTLVIVPCMFLSLMRYSYLLWHRVLLKQMSGKKKHVFCHGQLDLSIILITFIIILFCRTIYERFKGKIDLVANYGSQEFDIPQNVLDLVYSQTLSWWVASCLIILYNELSPLYKNMLCSETFSEFSGIFVWSCGVHI